MEMDRFPGKIWVVSHKPVAVAPGLGRMGIHRNVIHPRFGNFILLGTVMVDVEADSYDRPIDYDPCLECKLCVAADSRTWLGFLAKERNLLWALLTRRVRLRGSPRWLLAFGKCFPS